MKDSYSGKMIFLQLVFFCFLPLGLWTAYCAASRQCTVFSALRAILFGLASVLIVAALQWFLDPFTRALRGTPGLLFTSFIEAAFIEEIVKLTMLGFIPEIRSRRISPRTLLFFAVLAGLSFSSFETLMYSLSNPSVLFSRFVTALPVHVCATLFGGVFLIRARERRTLFSGVGIFGAAIVLHGAYNLCMKAGGYFLYAGLLCILVLVFCAVFMWRRTTAEESTPQF